LKTKDIVAMPLQKLQSFFESSGEKKIGDHDDHPLAFSPRLKLAGTLVEVRVAAEGLHLFEGFEKTHRLAAAATGINDGPQRIGETVHTKPVETVQGDVAEGGGEFPRITKLAPHRPTPIEEEVNRGVLLKFKKLDDEGF